MALTAYLILLAGLVSVLALSGASFISGVPAMLALVSIRRFGGAR